MSGIRYLNGLGLVASQQRRISNGKEFDKYFKAPLRTDPFLSYTGTTHDTINFMGDIIKNTLADTKEIAPVLRGATLDATLKNIFNFVFKHIQYKPDKPTEEELRRPARSWADRQTGVDCDCYAIFIGSILSNLRIPFALRMVKINGKPHFQHVYVVVPKNARTSDLEKNYFTVDPVLDTYNEEHPFTEKYDLFMQPIRYLNGTTLQGLQGSNPLAAASYYSPEAAVSQKQYFFDGLDYYMRDNSMNGVSLNGLNGLGFLKKLISIGSKIKNSKLVQKIMKPIMFKKDENGERTERRKIFSMRRDENGELNERVTERRANREERQNEREERRTERRARRNGTEDMAPMQPVAPSVTSKDVMDTVKNMDKGMGVESILNLIERTGLDKGMMNELVNAKIDANKGISADEARAIAKQTADAEKNSIIESVMSNLDRMKSGIGGVSLQTILLVAVGGGLLLNQMNQKNKVA